MRTTFFAPAFLFSTLVAAGAARAEVQMSGSFVAKEACAATPSIHSSANPGDVSLEASRAYKLLAKNKDEASHYLIEVPGAEPARRWVPVDCGDVSAGSGGGQAASSGKDVYLFVASWEPAFCKTKPNKVECQKETADGFDATHFSLHGLWPQPRNRQFCGVSSNIKAIAENESFDELPPVALSAKVRNALDVAMPGTGSALERHEWYRHGTCARGATPDSYFAAAIGLLTQLNDSKVRELFANNIGGEVTGAQIQEAMNQSFGPGAGDRVQVNCYGHGSGRVITQLEIDLTGDVLDNPSLSQLVASAAPARDSGCPSGVVQQAGR